MQQQNLHHFFSGGQPSAPVPLPAAKKRGRPREKAPEPVNPSRIKDPRGGDRKSSKFKAANQIPPVGNSGSSSLHRAVSAAEESATKRAKEDLPPAASSEPNVQSEPAAESPQQPPLPSDPEIAANRIRDQLLLAGASPELAEEMIAADFNNCPADETDDDGIDPDAVLGDPNAVGDESGDEGEGGGELRRQRPTNRYRGPDASYVLRITTELRKSNRAGRGLSSLWNAIRKRDVLIKAPSGSYLVEQGVKNGLKPDPSHFTAPDIMVMALHESFPDYQMCCPECGDTHVSPKGWADAPRGVYDLKQFSLLFSRG